MKRALVVDDEPLLRRQVAEVVAGYGFDEILEAENGVQAVEIALHQEVLLVVMDVGMPVMDGVTAAEKNRQDQTSANCPGYCQHRV
jgi:response regulator NasT